MEGRIALSNTWKKFIAAQDYSKQTPLNIQSVSAIIASNSRACSHQGSGALRPSKVEESQRAKYHMPDVHEYRA